MAKQPKVVSPFSADYTSEREFYLNILVNGEEIPAKEMQQIISFELDLHAEKAAVGKLVISTSLEPDEVWGKRVANRGVFRQGVPIFILAGPVGDVAVFTGLYCKEPKYIFKEGRVIVEVAFRDTTSEMKRRQRQRRFKGWSIDRILKDIAKRYKLIQNVDLNPEWLNIIFDDKFAFSQINQHDASMIDKLCRQFGWRWRIDGDRLEIYNPDNDANKKVKYKYGLEYRSGECTIAEFSPKVKEFTYNRNVPKITRKSFTARIKSGKGKTHPEGRKVPTKKNHKTISGMSDADQASKVKSVMSDWRKDYKKAGKKPIQKGPPKLGPVQADPAYTAAVKSGVRETGDAIPLAKNPWLDRPPPPPPEPPELAGTTIKKYDKYRVVGEIIVAELVLSIPTLRMRPRAIVQITAGGSSFFSGDYVVKRTRLTIDGQSGKIQVNMLATKRAWQKSTKIVPVVKLYGGKYTWKQVSKDFTPLEGVEASPENTKKYKKYGLIDGTKKVNNEGAGSGYVTGGFFDGLVDDGLSKIKKP
jgi:hypothetical protein